MYDWLEHLIQQSSTPNYFCTQAELDLRARFLSNWPVQPPADYAEFIGRFGSVRLFKELSYYVIHVNARPISLGSFLVFGHYDARYAAFKREELERRGVCLAYEIRDDDVVLEKFPNFADWLYDRVEAMRESLSAREWADICKGPAPFSKQELRLVKLRRGFRLVRHEFSDRSTHLMLIENLSKGRLPYLTVDVRYRSDDLVGGFWLPVQDLGPGERAWIEKSAYPNVGSPMGVEIWIASEPEPQDRDRYWEFR